MRVVRLVGGTAVVSSLLLAVPVLASALPAGTSAPVLDLAGPVVAFYAGTAEVDGSTTVELTRTGTKSRLDSTILFAKDSDALRPGARDRLRRLADQLHAQGVGKIAVTGYTDDLGSAAHGLDLSQRRAHRVAAELRRVLPAQRYPMTVRGLGEAHPAVPNITEANRRQNRRVVVTLTRSPVAAPAGSQPRPRATASAPTPSPTNTPAGLPPSTPAAPTPEPNLTSTSTATATGATTPSAAPPPPAAHPAASRAAHMPWRWIGGTGAALVALGALADIARRRHRAPTPPTQHPEAPPTSTPDGLGTTPADARPPGPPEAVPRGNSSVAPPLSSQTQGPVGEATATASLPTHVADPTEPVQPDSAVGELTPVSPLKLRLAADLAAWRSADTHRPRLSVLGPVHARTRGQALTRRRPYYTELLAYLALRPRGATVDDIADAFSLTPARVRTDMKILRDWLGTDPRTGHSYLPDARTTTGARHRGVAVYQLDGVLCDWHLFRQLHTTAATTTDDQRAAVLQDALDLVSGRPFDDTRPAGWGWLFEGDRIDLHATKAITDVAVVLARYHRTHHDEHAAARALHVLARIDSPQPV